MDQLTFFAEASPASPSPSPASSKGQGTLVISGQSSFDWSWCFGPAGLWWKTLVGLSGWRSMRVGLTWKARATPAGRRYCQLAVSMRRTDATASGLWPTPDAGDVMGSRTLPEGTTPTGMTPDGRKKQVGLSNAVEMALWPTPRYEGFDAGSHRGSPDSLHAAVKLAPTPRPCSGKGSSGMNRTEMYDWMAEHPMLPTPAASDHKGSSQPGQRRGQLSEVVVGMKLNPDWVARMMGLPDNWLNVDSSIPAGEATR